MFPLPAQPGNQPGYPPPEPPDTAHILFVGLKAQPPCPPPADVIVEKTELLPFDPT